MVAAAAYRHACKLEDTRTGEVHDYTRKKGIESSKIYLPFGVNPEWAADRGQLWSAVESAEKRVNSRLGRDLVLALPSELSAAQRHELAGEMAHHLADRYGVAVDVAIHQPSRHGDQRNHHAHMLMSSRRITAQGFGEKARELDDRERGPIEVEHIRTTWASMANRALEKAGQHVQIDHRSLKAQGVKRMPQLHLGPSASAMERRGIRTRLGEHNKACASVDVEVCRLGKEQAHIQQAEKQAQEALRAQEWVECRKELRQKEKEAGKAAGAFFERATQYEGRNGLFEAQKAYDKRPLWRRAFLDKEGTIQANTEKFHVFADKYRKKGEEAKSLAREYAEQGLQIALAHPEARDHGDQVAIERIETQRREEQKRELEKQEDARKRAEIMAIESSGYRGELNTLARIVMPNAIQKALDDWKKPYLDLIKESNEDKNVIEWCLKMAKYDVSPEGQTELKAIKSVLEDSLKPTGWSLSKKWRLVNPAMDTIRVQKDRKLAKQEALKNIQHQVSQERSRGRGR